MRRRRTRCAERPADDNGPYRVARAVLVLAVVASFLILVPIRSTAWFELRVPAALMFPFPSVVAACGVFLTRDRTYPFTVVRTCCAFVCTGSLLAIILAVAGWSVREGYAAALAGAVLGCFIQAIPAFIAIFTGFLAWEERFPQGDDADE